VALGFGDSQPNPRIDLPRRSQIESARIFSVAVIGITTSTRFVVTSV
jgi:hypothetical protein